MTRVKCLMINLGSFIFVVNSSNLVVNALLMGVSWCSGIVYLCAVEFCPGG